MSESKELQVVINQSGIKRSLNGPFEICVDRQALFALKERLDAIDMEKWSYGWITIFANPTIEVTPNQPPLPWFVR